MNATARKLLWGRLQTAGLVLGDLPQGQSSPWYVRAMLGAAGWIGAFFILGFIAAGFEMVMSNAGAALIAGVICCCGAFAIFRMASRGGFAGQFGLATGLAGQVLLGVAIFRYFQFEKTSTYLLFFCVEAVLTLLMPNFSHRIFTTLGAVAAASIGLAQSGLPGLALPLTAAGCALVWCGERRLAARAELWQPVGYGLAIGVLQTASTSIFGTELLAHFHPQGSGWLQLYAHEIGTALVAAVFLAVTLRIMGELAIDSSSREGVTIIFCTVLAMAVSFPAHGLAAALLILIIGFAGGNRVLLGLGILALASFLSHYYYQMRETLLVKSIILAATGALLLLARLGVRRLFPPLEVKDHA